MNKLLLPIILISLLSSCKGGYKDPSSYTKSGEILVHCSSEYNLPHELIYYKSHRIETNFVYVPEELKDQFKVYVIEDVNGNKFSINTDEMQNYVCKTIN